MLQWRYPAAAPAAFCLGSFCLPCLLGSRDGDEALLLAPVSPAAAGEVWFVAGSLQCQGSSYQGGTPVCLSGSAGEECIHLGSTGCVQGEQGIPAGCSVSCQPYSRQGWCDSGFGQKLPPPNNLKEPCLLHFQSITGTVGLLSPECEGFILKGVLFLLKPSFWGHYCDLDSSTGVSIP